jgi:prevent-host-death family protein
MLSMETEMKPALQIGAFEAKNRLSELLQRVENGEEVTITRHGKPVARLVPAPIDDRERVKEAVEWLKRTRKERKLDGLTIKELINEGRKY